MYRRMGLALLALAILVSLASAQASFEESYMRKTWGQIVSEAKGQTIYYFAWGGSDSINKFINGYFKDRLAQKYGISLKYVPVTDATVYVNKVLGEKQAGKNSGGSVDLVWTNGENFRTLKQGNLLFGPYAPLLPNIRYYNDSATTHDFGFPIEGFESPYGAAQVVMEYNSQFLPNPPKTIPEIVAWVKKNPGKFTYAAPPDFTGSVIVRHFFYANANGIGELMGPFNASVYDRVAQKTWAMLNEIEPYLWMGGKTYPENNTKAQELLGNGEIWFTFGYGPKGATTRIQQGTYPASIRTTVLDTGTIGNTNFLAIPYNSSAKQAAMVACNEMMDPEVQYLASLGPDQGGHGLSSPLDLTRVPREWAEKFASVPRHAATLSIEELNSHKVPEMMADWLIRIEKDWQANVLRK